MLPPPTDAVSPSVRPKAWGAANSAAFLPVLFLLVAAIPFEWLRVPLLGNRSVLLLPLFLTVSALAWTPFAALQRLQDFFRLAPWVHGTYAAYLTVLGCAAFLGPNLKEGVSEFFRACSLFGFYLVAGTYLTGQRPGAIGRTLLAAVPVAIAGFTAFCFYVFRAQGDNLLNHLTNALVSGDSNAVARRVLMHVVRYQAADASAAVLEEITPSVRNSISAGFLLLMVACLAYAPAAANSSRRDGGRSLSLMFTMIGAPVLLLTLMSRSSLLGLILTFAVCLLIHNVSRRGLMQNSVVVTLILLVLTCCGSGLAYVLIADDSSLLSMNLQRLQDITKDARFEHYRLIWRKIIDQPILGYGLGAHTPDGRAVHNFFLGAWFRAGIAGLVTATMFYCFLLGHYLSDVAWLTRLPMHRFLGPSVFLLPGLMVEPLTRAPLLGGQDGRYIRVEWLAIAFFLIGMNAVRSRIRDTAGAAVRLTDEEGRTE
ncbi:MAG: O-antigen ligase family protein [Planctomycetaceae bacterium]|nr:O-antigen ligase family protein [Planctomycetaceae bacterium]